MTNNKHLNRINALIRDADDIDTGIYDAVYALVEFDFDPYDEDADFNQFMEAVYQVVRPYARMLRWGDANPQ